MSRYPRQLGEGLCYHIRVQCNNRDFRFHLDEDFKQYIYTLNACREKLHFLLHHYMIMHSHVHLIITTPGPALLNQVMHRINQAYAYNYHKRHKRHGHFWINDYKCSIIDSDAYALTCMRYLDRNPVRANIIQTPKEWPWSAYHYYAQGRSQIHLDPHPSYLGLADQENVRRGFYRDFVASLFPSDEARDQGMIRQALRPKLRPRNKVAKS